MRLKKDTRYTWRYPTQSLLIPTEVQCSFFVKDFDKSSINKCVTKEKKAHILGETL